MESLNLGSKDRLSLVYSIVDCVGHYSEGGAVLLGRGVVAQHMDRGLEICTRGSKISRLTGKGTRR
jgi:hypothetical protein